MKKNSIFFLLAAIPALILGVVTRFMQILSTDIVPDGVSNYMVCGFLSDGASFFGKYSFYILIAVIFAAVLALSLLDKKRGGAYFGNDIKGFVDLKAVLLGFPLLVAGALTMYEGYAQTKSVVPSPFLIFVDFVLGGMMVILAFIILYKKEITPFVGFLLIIPALYYTLRGIGIFLKHMAVTTIPEYLIEGLGIIGSAVFFMQLAKLLTGNETKTTRPLVAAVGMTTAVMTISNAAAVIIADIANPEGIGERIVNSSVAAELAEQSFRASGRYGYHMAYASWADVLLAVTIILALIALSINNKPAELITEAELPDEPEAELPEDTEE